MTSIGGASGLVKVNGAGPNHHMIFLPLFTKSEIFSRYVLYLKHQGSIVPVCTQALEITHSRKKDKVV